MDIGIVSVRYAKALLKFATELHMEDAVYNDMNILANTYLAVPELRSVLNNPSLNEGQILSILFNAAGGEKGVCQPTKRFLSVVQLKHRIDILQFIANSYLTLYRKQKNITRSRLITPLEVDSSTEQRMKQLVEGRTNSNVEFAIQIDPDIEGGFILEYDTYRLDASSKTQLLKIRKQFLADSQTN